MSTYLLALGLTLGIELGVAFTFGLRKKDLYPVVAVNCITHPTLHLILFIGSMVRGDMWSFVPLLEGVVVLAEYQLLRQFFDWKKSRLFLLSLTMNSVSYFVGLAFVLYTYS